MKRHSEIGPGGDEGVLWSDRALCQSAGTEGAVSIVGTDEVDLERIGWVSPLRRPLTKSEAGDSVVLQLPRYRLPDRAGSVL